MKLVRIIIVTLAVVICAGAVSAFAKDLQFRVLSGKWTCPVCESKHLRGNQTECEGQGHMHALKLNDGTMVNFVPSDRANVLIHGGGRHSFPIKIGGFYDRQHQTLDVECYEIDGKWTAWCDQHQQMDLCRGAREPKQTEEEAKTSAK